MAARRPGPIGWLFIVAIAVALVAVAGHTGQHGSGGRRVALWGDSLAWEAQDDFSADVSAAGGTSVLLHTYGGTAPCDWLADIRKQSRRWHPTVAVLAFSGNAGSPCMKGRDLTTAYRSDVLAAVARLTRDGAHVVLVEAPPRLGQAVDAQGLTSLDHLWLAIAGDEPDTTIVPAGRAVTDAAGQFVRTRACAAGEGVAGGPGDGAQPDGVHFCPLEQPPVTRCPVPSAGAARAMPRSRRSRRSHHLCRLGDVLGGGPPLVGGARLPGELGGLLLSGGAGGLRVGGLGGPSLGGGAPPSRPRRRARPAPPARGRLPRPACGPATPGPRPRPTGVPPPRPCPAPGGRRRAARARQRTPRCFHRASWAVRASSSAAALASWACRASSACSAVRASASAASGLRPFGLGRWRARSRAPASSAAAARPVVVA